jgi:hypothetical protein
MMSNDSEQTDEDRERFDCPEAFCIQAFRVEEMVAHLQWDHGYSEYKARKRGENALSVDLDTDDPKEADDAR